MGFCLCEVQYAGSRLEAGESGLHDAGAFARSSLYISPSLPNSCVLHAAILWFRFNGLSFSLLSTSRFSFSHTTRKCRPAERFLSLPYSKRARKRQEIANRKSLVKETRESPTWAWNGSSRGSV